MTAESLLFVLVHVSASLTAWLLTYAVHSTCILGPTHVVLWTVLREAPAAWRDHVLKLTLLAGLLTTSLRTFGTWHAPALVIDASRIIEFRRWHGLPVMPLPADVLSPTTRAFGARLPDAAALLRLLPAVAVLGWAAYAAAVLSRVALNTARARAALGARRTVPAGLTRETFDQLLGALRIRRPVRLTATERVVSPVALGHTEVCLPERALQELDPAEQRSVLAHEAAHLARFDPWWLLAAATIESVLFFQPLNRMTRVRLQDEAEFLADEIAVRHAGSALALARCLAKVGSWLTSDHGVLAPALAEPRASLRTRVERLVRGTVPGPVHASGSVRAGYAALLAAPALVAFGAPTVSTGGVRTWGTPAFSWQGRLAPGQRIAIRGVLGSIRAEPTSGSTVVVTATRHGRATQPDIAFRVVEHLGGVTVCVIYPAPPGHAPNECVPDDPRGAYNTPRNDVEVEFLVQVPAGVGFSGRSATGDVTTGLLSGPIDAHSGSGRIDVATTDVAQASSGSGNVTARMVPNASADTLRIGSGSGHVRVTLPPDAEAAIDAHARLGTVRSDFAAIAGPRSTWWARFAPHGSVGEHASGVLGRGRPVLLLDSGAGDVSVLRARP